MGLTFGRDREETEPRAGDDSWSCDEASILACYPVGGVREKGHLLTRIPPQCHGFNFPHRQTCFRCRADRPDDRPPSAARGPVLTGESDECPQQLPSQYLVVRDLDESVTEETLADGLSQLFVEKPAATKDSGARVGAKLKSTAPTTDTSRLGAQAGVAAPRVLDEGPADGRVVEIRVCRVRHAGGRPGGHGQVPRIQGLLHSRQASHCCLCPHRVFVPAAEADRHESAPAVFSPVYNPSVLVKYWTTGLSQSPRRQRRGTGSSRGGREPARRGPAEWPGRTGWRQEGEEGQGKQ